MVYMVKNVHKMKGELEYVILEECLSVAGSEHEAMGQREV